METKWNGLADEHQSLLTLQRHFGALDKFAHVESRFCGGKQQGKAASCASTNPCARRACSRNVAVGIHGAIRAGGLQTGVARARAMAKRFRNAHVIRESGVSRRFPAVMEKYLALRHYTLLDNDWPGGRENAP
jgi:hypothetical protein